MLSLSKQNNKRTQSQIQNKIKKKQLKKNKPAKIMSQF